MKAGEDTVLPRMIPGTILCEHHSSGCIPNRVKVRAGVRFRDVSSEIDPIILSRQPRAHDQSVAALFDFEPACGPWRRLRFRNLRSARNEFRGGIAGRPIEREKSKEVAQIL